MVAAGALLASPAASGAASAASAASAESAAPAGLGGDRPIDCRDWRRPYPGAVRNTTVVYVLSHEKWGGEVDVTLWRGDAGPRGDWHYWAALTGRTRPGDQVWLEVWPPGGGPWHRCGPFAVGRTGQAISSPMAVWHRFTLVRACGRHNDVSACGRDKGAMVD